MGQAGWVTGITWYLQKPGLLIPKAFLLEKVEKDNDGSRI